MTQRRYGPRPGPTQRQRRVGEALRRRLSEILTRGETHDPDLARYSVTVSGVDASPDLRQATAWVLPLGGTGADGMMTLLEANRGAIRTLMGRGLGLRHTPELTFRLDESFDAMDRTRELLSRPEVRRDLDAPGDDGGA